MVLDWHSSPHCPTLHLVLQVVVEPQQSVVGSDDLRDQPSLLVTGDDQPSREDTRTVSGGCRAHSSPVLPPPLKLAMQRKSLEVFFKNWFVLIRLVGISCIGFSEKFETKANNQTVKQIVFCEVRTAVLGTSPLLLSTNNRTRTISASFLPNAASPDQTILRIHFHGT